MGRKKSKTELFGKHPLAQAIEPVVERWAKDDYPPMNNKQITPITRELLNYWFSDQAHEGDLFYPCQRRAIETIIYCHEILGVPSVEALFQAFAPGLLEQKNLRHGIEKMKHPRYAVKMATGTGKTWVMNALIVWQYFNRVKLGDRRFASHFLLMAPGNIVHERLLDSFLGKVRGGKRQPQTADIKSRLFMPDEWRSDFGLRVFSKGDLQENAPLTDSPFILITNWHQLMDTSQKREETQAENLGIVMETESISLRVERFMDFLTYNSDLMVINDEAHHVHSASDAEIKRWQESLETLREKISKNEGSLFFQYDFTATPFTIEGKKKEFFPHVVYDFGLVEAMRSRLVKQIFIEKSSRLSERIERLPEQELKVTAQRDESGKVHELSEVQKHMIDVGFAKLENLQADFERLKINKKPVLFVMAAENDEADMIADFIKKEKEARLKNPEEEVVIIHSGRKDSISEDDFSLLKDKVFASDDASNPIRVIVSVLMLKEGFDVKNVCVLVVLRSSESDLLTEQVIGRGIRLMFPEPQYRQDKEENYQKILSKEPLINSYDLLFVVEHPKYNEIYTQLTEAGAAIASGNSLTVELDSKSVLTCIDESRIKDYDISWPISLTYKTEEELDFAYFNAGDLPLFNKSFEETDPSRVIITDYHPDTQYRAEWELLEANFSYHQFIRNSVRAIIGSSRGAAWLSRYASKIAEIVDLYASEQLFGKKIDFSLDENTEKLKNEQLFYFVTNNVRKKLMKFVQNAQSSDVLEADWIRLSNFRELKIRMERSIETKKCLYPYLDFPYKGGFERKFTQEILENDSSVLAYVKLNQYVHRFFIHYINTDGYLVPYYPDFIVRTKDAMYVIETKSTKDASTDTDVKRKAIAAEQRCKDISKIKTIPPTLQPREWRYVLLPQNIFEEMEGSGLNSLIQRCNDNLALLKLKGE